MSKKQFFIGMILASLLGGIIAFAGGMYFMSEKSGQVKGFDQRQEASFVNYLSDDKFTVPDGINFVASAEVVTPAVVHVKSTLGFEQSPQRNPLEEFFRFQPRGGEGGSSFQMPMSTGSGVIISSDGYIVTNNHVVDGAAQVDISLDNNTRYTAKVVGADPTTDLALLKIEEEGLPFVRFGNSDDTKIGEWVLAVGNPFNLNSTVTAGIISAKARNIGILRNVENNLQVESFLQTDAVVNPGNSGGALVNLAGELIGINTAIATKTGTFNGYSFAVPSSLVRKVVEDLKEFGTVQRGLLGVMINDISPELEDHLRTKFPVNQGVYIREVNKGSGGAEAGLQPGDIILEVDGIETTGVSILQEMVARKRPGDQVQLKFLRDGKEMDTKATLKNFSGNTEIVEREVKKTYAFDGVLFENLTEEQKGRLDISGGAMISAVGRSSWRYAGARPGFIVTAVISEEGRTKISDADQLISTLEGLGGQEITLLGRFNDGSEYYFEVEIE